MDLKQYHLIGKGFSGRGVRLRDLDGRECARAERCAAAKVGKDGSMVEYRQAAAIEFAHRMIAEFTTQPVTDQGLLKASWTKATQEKFEEADGKLFFELFTPKDIAWFTARWQREYEISIAEIDAIEGKALTVTEA